MQVTPLVFRKHILLKYSLPNPPRTHYHILCTKMLLFFFEISSFYFFLRLYLFIYLIKNSSPLNAEVRSRNWKCTRFAHVGKTENGKGSPGKVEETRVHTPIALIFYFAFFPAPLGAEFCINFTSTLFKEAATKQRQTNFKHTFNLSKTDATMLQSQF